MSILSWHKKGLIFNPDRRFEWMQTHATTPVPLHLKDDIFRVFFSTRNALNQNQVGFVDIDIHRPCELLNISENPVLSLGELGTFDCDGIYATSMIRVGDQLFCYYAGWNAGLRGIFYSSIGLAISKDNGLSFEKYTGAPILSRDTIDRWSVMAPFVLNNNGKWHMWYTSGIKLYFNKNQQLKSLYDVKYAESNDGIHWHKTGIVSIGLGNEDTNIARACVICEKNKFKVWFPVVSKKTEQYRIEYGESDDGIVFERMPSSVTLTISPLGWDSEAVTYPYVFAHKGKYYMLYNGNQFGKDGFGLAVADDSKN